MITNEQRHEVATELQKEILFCDNFEQAGENALKWCMKVETEYQEELIKGLEEINASLYK